jgi:hypothetical protein
MSVTHEVFFKLCNYERERREVRKKIERWGRGKGGNSVRMSE